MKKILALLLCSSALFASVKSITDEKEFNDQIARGTTVVDFYATWCGPCKKLGPIIDKLSDEMDVSFVKVDTGASKLGNKYGVSSFPTVVIFKDGKEVNRFVGFKEEQSVRDFINQAK